MGTGMALASSMIEKEGKASSDGEREIPRGYSAPLVFPLPLSEAQVDEEKEPEKRPEMPEQPPKPDEELKSTKDHSNDHNGTVPFYRTGPGQFIIVEGMIVFLSSAAMLHPQVVGGFEALAFLVGFGEGEPGKPGYWPTELVTFAGLEAVAIYNIAELYREKYSRTEIFEKNFVGFHIALAISAATAYVTGYNRKLDIFARDEKKQQKLSINYVPLRDGVLLLANFEF